MPSRREANVYRSFWGVHARIEIYGLVAYLVQACSVFPDGGRLLSGSFGKPLAPEGIRFHQFDISHGDESAFMQTRWRPFCWLAPSHGALLLGCRRCSLQKVHSICFTCTFAIGCGCMLDRQPSIKNSIRMDRAWLSRGYRATYSFERSTRDGFSEFDLDCPPL